MVSSKAFDVDNKFIFPEDNVVLALLYYLYKCHGLELKSFDTAPAEATYNGDPHPVRCQIC